MRRAVRRRLFSAAATLLPQPNVLLSNLYTLYSIEPQPDPRYPRDPRFNPAVIAGKIIIQRGVAT